VIRYNRIKRSPLPARKTKPRVKRAAGPRRVAVLRNGDYLAFLHAIPCVVCTEENRINIAWHRLPKAIPCFSEAAHGPVNGLGSKGADSSCTPLCHVHHMESHRIGVKNFEARYGVNLKREAARLFALFRTGTTSL
jgi:hypothetical protein